jgi:hypothetical protein
MAQLKPREAVRLDTGVAHWVSGKLMAALYPVYPNQNPDDPRLALAVYRLPVRAGLRTPVLLTEVFALTTLDPALDEAQLHTILREVLAAVSAERSPDTVWQVVHTLPFVE